MKAFITLTVALFISLGAFAQNSGKTSVAPGSKAAPKTAATAKSSTNAAPKVAPAKAPESKATAAKSSTATPVVKTESPK